MKTLNVDSLIREIAAGLDDLDGSKTYVKLARLFNGELENLNLHTFPNIKSIKAVVDDNMRVVLPGDCIQPIQAAKLVKYGNDFGVYPLGRTEGVFIEPRFSCAEIEYPVQADYCFDYDQPYNYVGHYYGEYYDYSPSLVFGYWDTDNEVVYFQSGGCIAPGSVVLVKYRHSGECVNIPLEYKEMLKYKILMSFWENTRPDKAERHRRMFQAAHKMFVRSKVAHYSIEDYINAFVEGYSSAT